MKRTKSGFFRTTALVLALTVFAITSIPVRSLAYMVDTKTAMSSQVESSRDADMARAQRVLESKVVSTKLTEMGLTAEEVDTRLDKLTDEELHSFASQVDGLYAGGSGLGFIIGLLVIAILVVVVLQLTDHRIIID